MSELPRGWARATLADLIARDGVFSDGDWVETKDQDPDSDVRLTQLADVGEGSWRNRSARYMTSEAARRLGCTFLEAGDVLVARMPDPLGRACIFPGDPRPAVTAVDVCIVRPGSRSVDPRWLMWCLNTPQIRAEVLARQAGTTRKRISRKNLGGIPFPVPPLAEQRRIVAAIEEHLSRLDAAEKGLRSAIDRTDSFVRAAKYEATRPQGSWEVLGFEDAFLPVSDEGRKVKQRDYLAAGAYPVIDQGEKSVGGYTNDPDAVYKGPRPVILFGDHTRRFKLVRDSFAIGADGVRLLVPKSGWDPDFALAELETTSLPDRGYSRHYQFLRRAEFFRPPIDDQRRRAAALRSRVEQAAQLRRALEAGIRRCQRLRRSILGSAFRGDLIPQDPEEEPASVLLERIDAERAAAPKPKRQRREKATA